MSGIQARDYIREIERPLEEVGDVGHLPSRPGAERAVGKNEMEQWIHACAAKDKRIEELERQLASANAVKVAELKERLAHAERRAKELHLANITRPETELIVRHVTAIMMAITNIPDLPEDPKADDRRRQIIVGVQQLGQKVLEFCGAAGPFMPAREAFQIALQAFYGQASERDLEFLRRFGLMYTE